MPESSCLHIQDSASGPIRVVEIPWPRVRVGSASSCEVRLNDPELAGEVCRLQRRGGSWQIEPAAADSVRIDGRIVNGVRLLPFDTPIRIGSYCLTLHASRAAAPDWDSYHAWSKARTVEPAAAPIVLDATPTPPPIDRGADLDKSKSLLRDQQRWGERWRAAGEKLRSAAPPPAPWSGGGAALSPLTTASPFRADVDRPAPPAPPAAPAAPKPELLPLKGAAAPIPTLARTPSSTFPPIDRPRPAHTPRVAEPPEVGLYSREWVDSPPLDLEKVKTSAYSPAVFEPGPSLLESSDPREPEDQDRNLPKLEDPDPAPAVEIEEPAEESCDARISAWDPDWFDRGLDLEPPGGEAVVLGLPAPVQPADPQPSPIAEPTAAEPLRAVEPPPAEEREPIALEPPIGSTEPAPEPAARIEPSDPPPRRRPSAAAESTSAARSWTTGFALTVESESSRRDLRSDLNRAAVAEAEAPFCSTEDSPRTVAVDWPSVEDILAAHPRSRLALEESGRAKAAARPSGPIRARRPALAAPSENREPDAWTLPLWLGWPPLAFGSLLLGVLGCTLSWTWMMEARSAAVVAHRLFGHEAETVNGRPIPLPDWVAPPNPVWWRSTPSHLFNWAAYLARSAGARERADEIHALLEGSLRASPVYAPARLAAARIEDAAGGPSHQGLALGRDPIALAWTARKLLRAGKRDAAALLYRKALESASHPEFSYEYAPKFADDPRARRYLLPGEEEARAIIAELAADRGLKFEDWSALLPRGTVAPLAAARLLRERDPASADALLDLILEPDDRPGSGADSDSVAGAIGIAVRAEAFALRGRWKDAEQEYLKAVERIDHEATRRSWWFNLADVELQLKNEPQRLQAIEEVLAAAPTNDEIARRAADLRRGGQTPAEPAPRVRSAGLKAN